MAHLGTGQTVLKVRLSAKDTARIKRLAKARDTSVSDVVRKLIAKASVRP